MQETNNKTPVNAPEVSAAGKKRRILVVDDSATVRERLFTFLKQRGYGCHAVDDGSQALEAAGKNQYDLVFLDVVMPGMDGYAVCRKIKAMASYKRVPVVLLTSRDSTTDRVHGLMAGCSRYLTKPFDVNELDALMLKLCPPHRAGKSLNAYNQLLPAGSSGLP